MLATKTPLPRPVQRRTSSISFPRQGGGLPSKIAVKPSVNTTQSNVKRTIQAAFRLDHPLISQCLLAAKPIEDNTIVPSFWHSLLFPASKPASQQATNAWCTAISAAAESHQSFILPVKHLVKLINETAVMSNSKIEIDSKLVKVAVCRMGLRSMECLEESDLRSARLRDSSKRGAFARMRDLLWASFGGKKLFRNTDDQLVILYALLDDFLSSLISRLKEEKSAVVPTTLAVRDLLKGSHYVANYVLVKTSDLIRAVEVQFPSVHGAIGRLDLRDLVLWRLEKVAGSCEIYLEEGALLIGEETSGNDVKALVTLALR